MPASRVSAAPTPPLVVPYLADIRRTAMTTFTPLNDLERALLDARDGKVPASTLFAALFAATVFTLLNEEPGADGTLSDTASLLVLNSEAQEPLVGLFTAAERAAGWPERAPAYRYGLLVEFRWLLPRLADGVGIVLNPGAAVAVELPPELVGKLRASLDAGNAKPQ